MALSLESDPHLQDGSATERRPRGLAQPVIVRQCGDNLIAELAPLSKKEAKKKKITGGEVKSLWFSFI